jgi:chitosanase
MRYLVAIPLLGSLIACVVTACGGGGTGTATPTPVVSVPVSDARQREIEDRIVSAFENSTTTIQYASIVNIQDGRGYTAGRAGFTSGTGDMLLVVEEYTTTVPNNVLAPYLPALRSVNGTDSVKGLDGLVQAWKTACQDPQFIATQDAVNERLYRQPSRQLVSELGAKLPLTKLAVYEAGIQHGYGTDFDSVVRIAARATVATAGTPNSGIDEKKWLQAFLTERRKDLLNPANKATAAGWAASVSRADAIQSIYNSGNFNLDQPIRITVYGDTFSI